jgi:ribosomal protein S3
MVSCSRRCVSRRGWKRSPVEHDENPPPDLQINELMNRELSDAGYAGVEIRNAPMRTEIIIRGA